MPYRFAIENRDYADFSSGRFFYGAPGHPSLPVRLSSEIFQRCLAHRPPDKQKIPVSLYDPCCGSAYHLSALGYLHWNEIETIIASDIDPDILSVAERNLSLLTEAGVQQRTSEIAVMLERFGKDSHAAALRSAGYFKSRLVQNIQRHQIKTRLFTADATNPLELTSQLQDQYIDLVISDVPYGQRSNWNQNESWQSGSPLTQMLNALQPLLSTGSIVAIILNKSQTFSPENYRQIDKFQIGKRRVVLLKMLD